MKLIKRIIRKEKFGGEYYYMIYNRLFFWEKFYERWNSFDSAKKRVDELSNPESIVVYP